MSEIELETEWAWSQVEAMADGSLAADDQRRMRAAMRERPALRAAVDRARLLERELKRLGRASVPESLARRLAEIPGPARARSAWTTWGVPAAAAATGAVVAMVSLLALQQVSQPDTERELAMQEFRLAMSYLQRSAAMTGDDVTRELTNGLREALAVGRSAVLDTGTESQNGDQRDDQE